VKENSSKVLITGATGWLGRETFARVIEGKFEGITQSDLLLASSNGRDLELDSLGVYPTVALENLGHRESTNSLKDLCT